MPTSRDLDEIIAIEACQMMQGLLRGTLTMDGARKRCEELADEYPELCTYWLNFAKTLWDEGKDHGP